MDAQPFKSSLLHHGPPEYDSMRDRIVPMISEALKRTPLLGLELVGWDMMVIPMANAALLIGVAVAVRGYDLTGPGKELMQFRPFSGWKPSQDEVDEIVSALITGLRDARAQQNRQ
jgi:cytochrome P450